MEILKAMQMKTSYLCFTVSCFVPAGLKVISLTFSLEILLPSKTKWKARKKNHSLHHPKANKFSRNALIDSKPLGVTAHNTAFKSPFTIMPKFYSSQKMSFFQPQISQVGFLGTNGTRHSAINLKICHLATTTDRAKGHLRG